MGRLQQVSAAWAVAVASLGGCVHLHPDTKPEPKKEPPAAVQTGVDPGVQQASAKMPAAVPSASIAALAKAGAMPPEKGAATDIVLAWQNKVAQLPDPTKNGAMIHGVAGQLFLFTADSQFAQVNGRLTVEMTNQADGKRLGTWTFEKDVLKRMTTLDERFGKCYAIFLPWPEYDPTVSRVKFQSKYEPEKGGFPLFAPVATLTFDNESGKPVHTKRAVTGIDAAGFGGLQPAAGTEPRSLPPLDPLPVGGRNAQNVLPANPLPPNLPPLVITPQR